MKALIHVQHLLGTGHIVRAAAIGRALAEAGVDVVLASGNRVPPTLATDGLTIAALPLARAQDSLFKVMLDADGRPIDAAWKAARTRATLALLAAVQPDILLTETWPFGRRAFNFEMTALVAAARALDSRPVIAASIRDILVRKDDPEKERAMAELAVASCDRVLVHADPALIRLEESFRFADRVAPLVRYTGFVHTPSPLIPPGEDGRDEVIVSAGGGAVGAHLIAMAGRARALSARAGDTTWRLLVGHGHDAAALASLQAEAGPGVIVERARPDFPGLVARARLSISQAGYNTVLDVIAAGVPAVFVPFAEGDETEQSQRAALIAARGLAVSVAEDGLTPDRLAAAVDRALAAPPARLRVSVDGAAEAARILMADASARRRP